MSRLGTMLGRLRRIGIKKLIFSLLPAAALLIAVTLALDLLESRDIVDTAVPDDRVAYVHEPAFVLQGDPDDPQARYVANWDSLPASSFPKRKAERTFRVFVLGSSFAMGTPYVFQAVPGRTVGGMDSWISADLLTRYPSLRIEIVNAAAGGGNSGTALEVLKEVLEYEPDLIFVATGNNEGFIPPTALNPILHRWSLYRGLRKVIAPAPGQLGKGRPLHAPQCAPDEDLDWWFETNLWHMAMLCRKRRVPLALASMPVNLDYSDLDLANPEDATAPALSPCASQAKGMINRNECRQALDFLEGCGGAEKAFLSGRALECLGRFDEARQAYLDAVEINPLNRCRPNLNAIIRKRAAEDNLLLIDLEQAARDIAPHGIPGDELFLDYCHMHWFGYRDMGLFVSDRLIESGLLKGARGEPLPRRPLPELRALVGINPEYLTKYGISE